MFTGLIEEVGKVYTVRSRGEGATLAVQAEKVMDGLETGDSVAISGVCQTVVSREAGSLTVEVVRETMQRTRFGNLKPGDPVNLERALRASDRLGGHFVQGHVDGLIEVVKLTPLAGSWRLRLQMEEEGGRYVVEKGSVALDGVSLTVAAAEKQEFEVEIVPHTWEHTTLHRLRPGDRVHVEWDLIAKYVQHMLSAYSGKPEITLEKLLAAGFGD